MEGAAAYRQHQPHQHQHQHQTHQHQQQQSMSLKVLVAQGQVRVGDVLAWRVPATATATAAGTLSGSSSAMTVVDDSGLAYAEVVWGCPAVMPSPQQQQPTTVTTTVYDGDRTMTTTTTMTTTASASAISGGDRTSLQSGQRQRPMLKSMLTGDVHRSFGDWYISELCGASPQLRLCPTHADIADIQVLRSVGTLHSQQQHQQQQQQPRHEHHYHVHSTTPAHPVRPHTSFHQPQQQHQQHQQQQSHPSHVHYIQRQPLQQQRPMPSLRAATGWVVDNLDELSVRDFMRLREAVKLLHRQYMSGEKHNAEEAEMII